MAELTPEIRTVTLQHYFPLTVAPSLEFKQLAITEDIEFNRIWPEIWQFFIRAYVNYFDETGASRWEEMLSLTPAEGADLETRRRDILAKIMFSLPYTERKLQSLLDAMFGEGVITVSIDYNNYNLSLTIDDKEIPTATVYRYVRVIIPANLMVQWVLPIIQEIHAKHKLNCQVSWLGSQNYWNVGWSVALTLYWEGTHKLNGQDHTHYFDSSYRFDAIDGNDVYRSDQRHYLNVATLFNAQQSDNSRELRDQTLNIKKLVNLNQTSNGRRVYVLNKLDSSIKLDGTYKFAGTASGYGKGMYSHSATITAIKNGVETEVAI